MKKILALVLGAAMALNTNTFGINAYAQSGITGEITVSCYDTLTHKGFLETAARSFEEKYPGTKVNVESFSAMPEVKTQTSEDENGMVVSMVMVEVSDDPKSRSDYISRLNTELISGGGADILAVDIIPYYKYADNGQLEDLREYMDNDPEFDMDNYYSGIFDATMYNSGQYILPLDFGFECLSFDTSLMDAGNSAEMEFGQYTYEQLIELGYDSFIDHLDPEAENPIKLFNLDFNSFLEDMIEAYYSRFVDIVNKEANFTDGRFADILNKGLEYHENGYLNVPIDFDVRMEAGFSPEMLMTTQEYLYKSINQLMLMQSLIPEDMSGLFRTYSFGFAGNLNENDKLIGMLANDNGESIFTSSMTYAMNSNSENKDLAWEFLKYLISDQMQGSMAIRYNPVNREALLQKSKHDLRGRLMVYQNTMETGEGNEWAQPEDAEQLESTAEDTERLESTAEDTEQLDPKSENAAEKFDIATDILNTAAMSYFTDEDIELSDDQQAILDTYMDYMERYIEMLNCFLARDQIIDEMIISEIENFISGTRTAEEVAKSLQSRIAMYLQE